MSKSVGRHSPMKAVFYTVLQEEPYTLPPELSGGVFDRVRKESQKSAQRIQMAMQEAIDHDEICDNLDAIFERMNHEKQQSPDYQLLGLTNHPGHLFKKDVRNAYRRQARKLHPDAGGTDDTFKELYAAYRRILASVPKE